MRKEEFKMKEALLTVQMQFAVESMENEAKSNEEIEAEIRFTKLMQ